jgi:hypothetical protein
MAVSSRRSLVADKLKLVQLYWVLLAIFAVGRWALSMQQVPYDRGNPVFSIITLTFLSAAIFAAFARRWRSYRLLEAAILGAVIGFSAQVVIFVSTWASYSLGIDSYFTHPLALNAPSGTTSVAMADALTTRAQALVVGPIVVGIAASIGWMLGAVLPERKG